MPTDVQPTVSFIIPAYDAESTLHRAAHSVIRQSGAPFEIIIVDDGSRDRTLHLAREIAFVSPLINVISQTNRGTAGALNAGRRASRGAWVTHVDADDELCDDYLSTMISFVDAHPAFDFYSHDLWDVGSDGRRSRHFGWEESRSIDLDEFLNATPVVGPGTLYRAELLDRLGGYREDCYNEDFELWLRALASGARHLYCPEALYLYHKGATQKTRNRVKVYGSSILILREAVSSGIITGVQVTAAEQRILSYEKSLEEHIVAERLEGGAVWLESVITRLVPAALATPTLRALRPLTWAVRPMRRIWARCFALRRLQRLD